MSGLVPSRYLTFGSVAVASSGRRVRPVYHAATARAYLVDEVTARRLEGHVPAGWSSADDGRLAEAGLLRAPGRDEAAEVIAASRAALAGTRERRFVIMPTGYCNMGCSYCGQLHRRGVTAGRHRSALKARVEAAAAAGADVDVRWFGGEPLMGFAVICDLASSFTAAADREGVGYRSRMATNGALLDRRKLSALAGRCRVDHIEVTIDGPADEHDASRRLKGGGGSFYKITGVLREALDDPALSALRFSIRTNVGVHNVHLAGEFAAAMAAAGLRHERVSFYPAPIHPWGNDVTAMTASPDALATAELAWYRAYLDHGLTASPLPAETRSIVCTAVNRAAEVVAPDGGVYSCTEQPLVPAFEDRRLADVAELPAGATRPAGEFDDWYDDVAAGVTPCRSCPILPLCGGACPKLWREGSPPCPPARQNLAARLDLYAEASGCTLA